MTDINQKRKDILARFGLFDGQFFAFHRYKNLQWYLNGEFLGFGDLTTDQIIKIQRELEDDERFVGHGEHYGTQFQASNLPRVVITPTRIYHEIEIRNLGLMS